MAIIGAGIGGLAAALVLAQRGAAVTVLERADETGGKLRQLDGIDAGPTVLTMRPVLEALFEAAGERLDAHLALRPAEILARHAWDAGTRLDLFADLARSADAIGVLAGAAEARGFLRFAERAGRIHDTLEQPFMHQPSPALARLLREVPLRQLAGIDPFSSLWRETGRCFRDPRLRQLFGRYATYCGSSPFLCPATLMLVSHVERLGVWLCGGGMARIGQVLRTLCLARGVAIRTGCAVGAIAVGNGRCTGVVLEHGEPIEADAVLCNADVAALSAGGFGRAASRAVARTRTRRRSFSAMTIALRAETGGFPLCRHTVLFSRDYGREFAELAAGRLPSAPTVYLCAQDRDDRGALTGDGAADGTGGGTRHRAQGGIQDGNQDGNQDGTGSGTGSGTWPGAQDGAGGERLLMVVNAPANGDRGPGGRELRQCETAVFRELERCGLQVRPNAAGWITGPLRFARMFPSTGGGLYGQSSHGWMASFRRPGARSRLPGLYLAGGSTHPGPGLSMAALSGMMAAEAMLEDCASTSR